MIIIDDKLISDDVFDVHFVCKLDACKGICCWEGDSGAPVEEDEISILEQIYPKVKPYLTEEGKQAIEEYGTSYYDPEVDETVAPLQKNAACAYMIIDEQGMCKCGIEKAYEDGVVDFKKPISCHLYPIRVLKLPEYEALNYNKWDICSPACGFGQELGVPMFRFLKEPLTRRYGAEFYDKLELAHEAMQKHD